MGNRPCFPEYGFCTANIACSCLEALGAEAPHRGMESLPRGEALKKLLDSHYDNLVLFVVDGMGSRVLEENARQGGFFQGGRILDLTSVFPATTVASTTCLQSGLYPAEHSLLGWNCYFPSEQMNVAVFRNTFSNTNEMARPYNVSQRHCPYISVRERLSKANIRAGIASEFYPPYPKGIEGACERVEELCAQEGKKFIYAYVNEPDNTMHAYGVYSQKSVQKLRSMEERLERMAGKLRNTLLLITADHGHMDMEGVCLWDYPELVDCLIEQEGPFADRMVLRNSRGKPVRDPSLEPRAVNFFVQEEKRERFEELFLESFGEDFLLFSRKEVLERELFGPGKPHPEFPGMLGDYVAAGFGHRGIFVARRDCEYFHGHHTGLLEEEMRVPLLGYLL